MREGSPISEGSLVVWPQFGRSSGADAISLRVMEFSKGISPGLRNLDCDEVIYVLEGTAKIYVNGRSQDVNEETGIYLRAHTTFTIENSETDPLVLVSSRCPDPGEQMTTVPPLTVPLRRTTSPVNPPMARLADRAAIPTGDRWYRVLVDEAIGSTQVTQFVGAIPPGRAPDHFHEYEEVLFILRGSGRMWAGAASTSISAGLCVYLPRRQVHCVENTGTEELRLLGVFYPAGSPAVRYDPD